MTKVVINTCYGGFSLSPEASMIFNDKKGLTEKDDGYINPEYGYCDIERHDKDLVQVVESLGKEASGDMSELTVVSFEGCEYMVSEYDGMESLETPTNQDWVLVDTKENREKFPEKFL